MRIAVAIDADQAMQSPVSGHFGHAPYFLLAETDGCSVSSWTVAANPFLQGHQPGQIPEYINALGAKAMICGGMGGRAMSFFDQFGIQTAMFQQGTAGEALAKFLAGELGVPEPCSGDQHGGEHNHEA